MKKNPLYANPAELKRPSGAGGARTDELGRSPFRKDYGRLLHAPAFRRLQGKTQLFPGLESDFFRNRLTHSLEVSQIARGIAGKLNQKEIPAAFPGGSIAEDLVEFAAIAHDLGHPPFGHNGEYALDEIMREHGGFEGNAQTLRILTAVERKLVSNIDAQHGLDLTYRSLASVLKYDTPIKLGRDKDDRLRKGYYVSERKLVSEIKRRVAPNHPKNQKFKTIECAIMDIADDIAYSTYDLEDSLHANFLTPSALLEGLATSDVHQAVVRKVNSALVEAGHDELDGGNEVFEEIAKAFNIQPSSLQIGDMTPAQQALVLFTEAGISDRAYCSDALLRTRFTSERVGRLISAVELIPNEPNPQLSGVRLRRPELLQVEIFKHLNYELVIRSPRLAVVEHRGKGVIFEIFGALEESKGALLPTDWRARYHEATGTGIISSASARKRVLCDYIACMTDRYAVEVHSRLFGEGSSIFKPL